MAASCAACLAPIATGERFVLSGTEVFHRTCARGINRSKATRLELRVTELERDLQLARNNLAASRGFGESRAQLADRIQRDKDAVDRDLQKARAARDAALRDSSYWQERFAAAERLLVRTRADADAAEAIRARPPPPPPQGSENPPVAKDDRDATEIRFSLLELDKK
jgi:hypothetical protein